MTKTSEKIGDPVQDVVAHTRGLGASTVPPEPTPWTTASPIPSSRSRSRRTGASGSHRCVARACLPADADPRADLLVARDRKGRGTGPVVEAARARALRQRELRRDRRAGRFVDERHRHVPRIDVRHGQWERPLNDRLFLELHASARIDRIDRLLRARNEGADETSEDERDVGFRLFDVEHQVRRLARPVRLGVVVPRAADGKCPAVEERRDASARASARHVVGASGAAPVLRRRVPDRVVCGAGDRRVGREAVAEVGAAREGRRVHLHLEVSLVDVPVADVDHEQEEKDQGRCEHREEDGDSPRCSARVPEPWS